MNLDLNKIQAQKEAFEKHPVNKLGLQNKIYYLKALGLVLHLDDKREGYEILAPNEKGQEKIEIRGREDLARTEEKEYFKLLIDSFGIKEDFILEFFEEFELPDEEEIFEILDGIREFNLEKYLLVDVFMFFYMKENARLEVGIKGQENEGREDLARTFFYDLCDIFKIDKDEIKEIEIFAEYVNFKTKKVYELFKKGDFSLKFEKIEYLLKFYNIKEDKFNEGDYRIYFDEAFKGLKGNVLFFSEYNYEKKINELKDAKSLFFGEYDYENILNEFI